MLAFILFVCDLNCLFLFSGSANLLFLSLPAPDINMPGFAQHRGDHVQVTVGLPVLERAEETTLTWGCDLASGFLPPFCGYVSCMALHARFLKWQRCRNDYYFAGFSAPFPLLLKKIVPVLRSVETC